MHSVARLLLRVDPDNEGVLATPLLPFIHYAGRVAHDGCQPPRPALVLPCAVLGPHGAAAGFDAAPLTGDGALVFVRDRPQAIVVKDLCTKQVRTGGGLAHLSASAVWAEMAVSVLVFGTILDTRPAGAVRRAVPPRAKLFELDTGERYVVLAEAGRGSPFFRVDEDVHRATLEHVFGLDGAEPERKHPRRDAA